MSDFASTWDYIERGVADIMCREGTQICPSPETYMNMYTAIHNFCVAPPREPEAAYDSQPRTKPQHTKLLGGQLYQMLFDYLKNYLHELCDAAPPPNAPDEIIGYYTRHWERFTTGAQYLDHIFSYLNRHWVKQERDEGGRKRGVYEVNTLCLVLWRDYFFEPLRPVLVPALLAQIERDRNGEHGVDYESLLKCVHSMVSISFDDLGSRHAYLRVYSQQFEEPFLKATANYYRRESSEYLQQHGVVPYMHRVRLRLLEERERLARYLHPSTEQALMAQCEELLIDQHKEQIQQEFGRLLAENRVEDMRVMYELLTKVNGGVQPIMKQLMEFVEQKGMERMEQLHNSGEEITPGVYVEALKDVCMRFEWVLKTSFGNSAEMREAVDAGCAKFINNNIIAKPSPSAESRTPELLARHADSLLRKGSKAPKDEEAVNKGLGAVLRLLQYADEKEVFEKHYSRMLSKRLVHQASANQSLEQHVVSRLATYCGFEYSNKLQRMFQDVHVSAELQQQFAERIHQKTTFTPLVLAEAFWPLPYREVKPFELPQPLKQTFDSFVEMYEREHQTRKLKWLWNFGKGEMRLNLDSGRTVLLQVSIYQMMILLAFNDRDAITRDELAADVRLPAELLDGSLEYIIKAGVLLRDENGVIRFNHKFESKKQRLQLNHPLKADASGAGREQEERKQTQLQAAIVRVVKTSHKISHQELEMKVRQTLNFEPTVAEFKKALSAVIDREYLRRSADAGDYYEYN